jgi:hypothetical protein
MRNRNLVVVVATGHNTSDRSQHNTTQPLGNTWQCSDSNHYIRARANTKQEAIDQAHKEWDEYKKN